MKPNPKFQVEPPSLNPFLHQPLSSKNSPHPKSLVNFLALQSHFLRRKNFKLPPGWVHGQLLGGWSPEENRATWEPGTQLGPNVLGKNHPPSGQTHPFIRSFIKVTTNLYYNIRPSINVIRPFINVIRPSRNVIRPFITSNGPPAATTTKIHVAHQTFGKFIVVNALDQKASVGLAALAPFETYSIH